MWSAWRDFLGKRERVPYSARLIANIAEQIAEEIGLQCDIDNLGDCESIVLMENLPVLNLIRLTEGLIERGIVRL